MALPIAPPVSNALVILDVFGIAVFAGMLFASTVGLFFIPMLYVLIQRAAYLVGRNRKAILGTDGGLPALAGGHD